MRSPIRGWKEGDAGCRIVTLLGAGALAIVAASFLGRIPFLAWLIVTGLIVLFNVFQLATMPKRWPR